MRIGRFKVSKIYHNDKTQWAIYGINDKRIWVVCFDETRKPKELMFDLQYDACAYLEGFVEWQTGELLQRRIAQGLNPIPDRPVKAVNQKKQKARKNMAKKSKRRNRH